MKLLHIDSSIMGEQSVTRRLTRDIVSRLSGQIPAMAVTYWDLAKDPVAHTSPELFATMTGLSVDRTSGLDVELASAQQALQEFITADIIVIGAPMYNLMVPSQLKAWFDKLMVAGKTFKYSPTGPVGLLKDRPVYLAMSFGGFHASHNLAEPYLRAILNFLGIRDIHVIRTDGVNISPVQKQKSIAAAELEIAAITLNGNSALSH